MAMVINTNLASITAQRHLANSKAEMDTAMERLSSGKRINQAGDDAAGLTIAHQMDNQIASLNQANRNANDGIAMINLAEGAMDQFSNMLVRMKELATQSANGIYSDGSDGDRANLQKEFDALQSEITRIANVTVYNGINVLNASSSSTFQVGDKSTDTITVNFADMRSTAIGGGDDTSVSFASRALTAATASTGEINTFTITAGGTGDISSGKDYVIEIGGTTYRQSFVEGGTATQDTVATLTALGEQLKDRSDITSYAVTGTTFKITGANTSDSMTVGGLEVVTPGGLLSAQTIATAAGARTAMTNIDEAIKDVDVQRSALGAKANQLEHTAANLQTRVQYTAAARSQILDADYAIESANLAKAQVLQQAGTAMLAQANASTQNVLSLLK